MRFLPFFALLFVTCLPVWAGSVDATQFSGAHGDARRVDDAVTSSGSTTITSATAGFTQADQGKLIWGLSGTGLVLAKTTIATVVDSSTVQTLTAASSNTTSVKLIWGWDDTDALQAAYAAAHAQEPPGTLTIPAGGYIFSRQLFDANESSVTASVRIVGAGRVATVFYPTPDFDFTSASSNEGIFWRSNGNSRNAYLAHLSIDGALFSWSGASGYHLISDAGNGTLLEGIGVHNCNGFTAGLHLTGAHFAARQCYFEGLSYRAISVGTAGASFYDCYSGNAGFGLSVNGVPGTSNVGFHCRWFGGMLDECSASSVDVASSTDVVIIGARIFSGIGQYAVKVGSNCEVRAIGCEMIPFGATGNRGGAQVLSGGTLSLQSCRLQGQGTLFGLDNAGLVLDGGANSSNSKTGAGTITIPTL